MKNLKLKKHRLGIFKLKDSLTKNTVQLDIPTILRNIPGTKHIWITKVPKENNKVVIDVHYIDLPKPKNEDKIQLEKN